MQKNQWYLLQYIRYCFWFLKFWSADLDLDLDLLLVFDNDSWEIRETSFDMFFSREVLFFLVSFLRDGFFSFRLIFSLFSLCFNMCDWLFLLDFNVFDNYFEIREDSQLWVEGFLWCDLFDKEMDRLDLDLDLFALLFYFRQVLFYANE